ncbi:hypothetical protein VCR26J2_30141 [Vibrio coralliirubri]|nr:hypothetical protein VCR6J2_30010 [Vibrio coralliirubri]CDT63644.1 hypothetical protein VCR1J2_80142 [Vibrio coralliirubri]CDT65206.1 hypothetical protein VCR26J2_30141 [Vibrio coralliirubri]CDT91141.1 hypothetical protein VCR8J2_40142 [Vibrio coralliirubri]
MVVHRTLFMVMGYKTAVTGYEYRDTKSLKADAGFE